MKKYISLILIVSLLISLLSGLTISATNGEAETETVETTETTETALDAKEEYVNLMKNKTPDNETIDPEFTLIDENENLALYAITNNDNLRMGEILIQDKKSGYVWRSNPVDAADDEVAKAAGDAYSKTRSQIVIEYSAGFTGNKSVNSYKSCVEKPWLEKVNNKWVEKNLIECKIEGKSVKFVYHFGFEDGTDPISRKMFIRELEGGKENKNNINVDDFDKTHYFSIPVKYSLEGDAFNAEILANDKDAVFKFTKPGTDSAGEYTGVIWRNYDYNILKIELLPAFGATSYNESGYMFIPDGSGALVYLNNGRKNIPQQPYSAPVYGNYKERNATTVSGDVNEYLYASDRYMLPVFGTVKDDGHALMGVIKDNASVSYVNVIVSGYESCYNKVYPSFLNRIVQDVARVTTQQPIDKELRDTSKNYSVKYYCLSGDDADYVGMAKRYRQYLIDEEGMVKSNDYREGALLLDMYAGVEKKTSILGIPWNKFEVLTTYKDLMKIADDMSEANVDNLIFKYNDWVKKSSRKKIQVKPKFEGSIGGKKGYKEAYKYLSDKGISLYMNVDFINFSESGNGYSMHGDSVKYTSQAPAYQTSGMTAHINMGNRWCILKAPLVKEAALKFAEKCADNELYAISIENIGDTLYSDGANKNGHTRGDSENNFAEIINTYHSKGIKVLLTEPSQYAIANTDVVMGIPSKDTYVELANEAVPFYQIAMRGYKTYTTEAVNMASNPDSIILNAVESGSCLAYSFVAGETTGIKETYLSYLYSCNYGQWKDEMIEDYKEYAALMNKVKGADIDDHEKLAEDIYVTTYSNGVKVYVNYSNESYKIGVVEIPANGYAFIGGGK